MAAIAVAPALVGFSSTAEANEIHKDVGCDSESGPCGVIVYVNEGGYVVNPTHLYALSSQPATPFLSKNCKTTLDYSFNMDVDVGQYITYILPADCKYELKINIVAGSNKSRTWLLTPGCQITAKTDGTTLSNKWHVSEKWISEEAKYKVFPNGDGPDHPADPAGNPCG
jgi:hypothetical protein